MSTNNVIHLRTDIPRWTFAERVRKVRRDSGLIQEDFARAIGVKLKRYQAWETGKNTPDNLIEIVETLENVTGVPRTWFLGWNDQNTPGPSGAEGVPVGEEGFEPPTFRVETRHLRIAA